MLLPFLSFTQKKVATNEGPRMLGTILYSMLLVCSLLLLADIMDA